MHRIFHNILPLAVLILQCYPGNAMYTRNACNLAQIFSLNSGVRDAQALANALVDQLTILQAMIDYAFSGVAFANIPINYSRLRTYEAVFGQLWFGVQTPAQLGSTYFALENLGQVLGYAEATLQYIQNLDNSDLQIWCDDSWLVTADSFGTTIPGKFWDNRIVPNSNPLKRPGGWINSNCRTPIPGPLVIYPGAFTIPSILGKPTAITLCPIYWTTRWNAAGTQETILNYKQVGIALYTQIGQPNSLIGSVLFHEFMHATNPLVSDQKCLNGETAYFWACVTALAQQSPSLTLKNADSYTILATAYLLNEYDWSLGYAQALSSVPLPQ